MTFRLFLCTRPRTSRRDGHRASARFSPKGLRGAVAAAGLSALALAGMPVVAQEAAPGTLTPRDAGPAPNPPAGPAPAAPEVVVVGTRLVESPFDIPASVDRVAGEALQHHRLQVNLGESLGGVPGLTVRDRQNYAQDLQLSVRGFGARSTFGIRGVRVIVDGIPATLPDGQGQVAHADLGSAQRIDVLRGPFSALYGNSSGGVVEVTTQDGSGAPTVASGLAAGADGMWRANAQALAGAGAWGAALGTSRFATQGYRAHSAARREVDNLKLTWRPTEGAMQGDAFTVVANHLALPEAQDPLGLTRAQFATDPRGVDPVALAFNTRKQVAQSQVGATAEHRVGEQHRVRAMVYAGHRATEQYQAIPTAPQASPTHPGGVIDLARDFRGADLRWTWDGRAAPKAEGFAVVAGVSVDSLDEHRQGYENFSGDTLGVKGALRRDERNRSSAVDQYLQATWRASRLWRFDAGVRHSAVRVRSQDNFIAGPNGDDSGRTAFEATTPVLSALLVAADALHLYATAGRGFETPTLNELAYRADGSAGINTALRPARSSHVEVGAKWRPSSTQQLHAAVFAVRTDDEIVTRTNQGGRASFQNAGRTRRDGLEVGWSLASARHWHTQAALTWLDARYEDAFTTCTAPPCATPTLVIPAGNRLPGVARSVAFAAVRWLPPDGWNATAEWRATSRVWVNDLNSDAAAGGAVAGASVGHRRRSGAWTLDGFVRVDNLFDRAYAGSVIVNEGNGRYFEPAPGRSWLAGVNASLAF